MSVNISTQWQDTEDPQVVNAGDHADDTDPPESEEEPLRAVIIGRK